jgi:cytochrome P450
MSNAPTDAGTHAADPLGADFDHHSSAFTQAIPGVYRELHAQCPVVHSERYGGFRMFSRYEDIQRIARDPETFSSDHDLDGTAGGGEGILIPAIAVRLSFLEMDPPLHRRFREVLAKWLGPARIAEYEDRMRAIVVERIEHCRALGEFDVVDDLANPLTAMLTLDFAGMPIEDWELYLRPVHEQAYIDRTSPEFERVLADLGAAREHTRAFIARRREEPTDDLASVLLATEIDGRPLTEDEIIDYLWVLMGGGFDTTSGAIAHSMRHLTEHPEDRRRLSGDRALIPTAIEEFVRHFSPSTTVARTVTQPVTVAGEELEPGDRVLLCWGAANHDPKRFDAPDEVQLDRSPNRHLGWGDGIHRCVGTRFARTEMRIFYEELLDRMPNFAVRCDEAVQFPSVGVTAGFVRMPAVADAG